MSACPLSGASYHTLEAPIHSFDNVDPEALGSLDAYVSEKKIIHSSNIRMPLLDHHIATRRPDHRATPVLLTLLIFSCLAFVGSAFWSCFPHYLSLPDVPDRHAPFADNLSAALRTQAYRTLANENFDDALEMMCVLPALCFPSSNLMHLSITGARISNVHSMDVAKPICGITSCGPSPFCEHLLCIDAQLTRLSAHDHARHLSLNSTYVAESAVVLHWQGTDNNLKPVLTTNSDGVSGACFQRLAHNLPRHSGVGREKTRKKCTGFGT